MIFLCGDGYGIAKPVPAMPCCHPYSLTINFNDRKLLIIMVNNLDSNLQNKELLVTKIITIMNKKIITGL